MMELERKADPDAAKQELEKEADPDAAKPAERVEMITSEELADSREWVRNFFFDQAPAPQKPVYYTYDRAVEFIGEAAAFIKQKLPEYI